MHEPDTNRFDPLTEEGALRLIRAHAERPLNRGLHPHGLFKVGEETVLNGVVFRARKITRRDLILRPVGRLAAESPAPKAREEEEAAQADCATPLAETVAH